MDAAYWIRQILALFFGIIFGLLGVEGSTGMVGFVVASTAALYLLVPQVRLAIERRRFRDSPTLPLTEGMQQAMPLFLVTWIVVYSNMLVPV